MAGSENTTALPFARLPRETIEAIIDAALAELDARDGDPDMEDEPETMHARFTMPWPGTPEDEEDNHDMEEDHDREHDPAEHEAWFQPNWEVSAAHSPLTPLFIRSAAEASHG